MYLGLGPCVLMATFLKARDPLGPHQIPFAATVSAACGSVTEMFMASSLQNLRLQILRFIDCTTSLWHSVGVNQPCLWQRPQLKPRRNYRSLLATKVPLCTLFLVLKQEKRHQFPRPSLSPKNRIKQLIRQQIHRVPSSSCRGMIALYDDYLQIILQKLRPPTTTSWMEDVDYKLITVSRTQTS